MGVFLQFVAFLGVVGGFPTRDVQLSPDQIPGIYELLAIFDSANFPSGDMLDGDYDLLINSMVHLLETVSEKKISELKYILIAI